MTISPLAAFLGGTLTLLAPCSIMVLPSFFAYAFSSPRTALGKTFLFWLGLITVLIPLGASLSALTGLIRGHADLVTRIIALVVIVCGVLTAADFSLPRPHLGNPWKALRRKLGRKTGEAPSAFGAQRDRSAPLAIYLLGAAYGIAGVGCAGPILGAVLASSSLGGSPLTGAVTMVVYATGMTVPLLILSLIWRGNAERLSRLLRPRPVTILGRETTWMQVLSGLCLIVLGAFLLYSSAGNPLAAFIETERLAQWEEQIVSAAGAIPTWAILVSTVLVGAALFLLLPQRSGTLGSGAPASRGEQKAQSKQETPAAHAPRE